LAQTEEGDDAGKCEEAEEIEGTARNAIEAAIIGIIRTGLPPAA